MNPCFLVTAPDGHAMLLISPDELPLSFPSTGVCNCVCNDYQFKSSDNPKVVASHTTEYNSRCLSGGRPLVDERKATQ